MSSHHIVRDSQEPALWITQAGICSKEIIQELLEWSPWVLVSESALAEVLAWGLKIDAVLIQEASSTTWATSLEEQNPLDLLICRQDEDSIALDYFFKKQISTVHIVAMPHEKNAWSGSKLEWVFFHQNYKTSFHPDKRWKKWVAQGQQFLIHSPVSNLRNLESLEEARGTYRAIQDGFVEIYAPEGGFWLSEQIN